MNWKGWLELKGANKRSILFVFDSIFTYRTYIESSLEKILESNYEIQYLFVDNGSNNLPTSLKNRKDVIYTSQTKISKFILTVASVAYWQKNAKYSNSFRVRLKSLLIGRRLFYSSKELKTSLPAISTIVGIILGKLHIRIPKTLYFLTNNKLTSLIMQSDVDLIAHMTVGGGIGLSDLITLISRRKKVKSLIMLENWDNIYSKAVFWHKPDILTVWNDSAKNFANRVHGIPNQNIYSIPSARVFSLLESIVDANDSKDYVFFAGGSLEFEFDLKWLYNLSSILEQISAKQKIIYLPHPVNYRYLTENFIEGLPQNVELAWTPSLSEIGKVYPPLDIYPEILKKSTCLISPLSTLSLEAALVGVPSIGLDFFDRFDNKTCSAFHTFEHFKDLVALGNFNLIDNPTDLKQCISAQIDKNFQRVDSDNLDWSSLKYNYSDLVLTLFESALSV